MLMIFVLLLINIASSNGKLFGDHICQTEIIEPQEMTQWELKNRTVRKYKWCMNVPPRCSVYYNIVVNETKSSVKNVSRYIEKCCEGFQEHNNNCVSLCHDCKNGLCMRGLCICHTGWEGTNCNTRIPNYEESNTFHNTISAPSATTIKDSSLPNTTANEATYEMIAHNTFSTQQTSLGTLTTSTGSPSTLEPTNKNSSSEQMYSSFESSTYDISSIMQINTSDNISYYFTLAKNVSSITPETMENSSVNTPTLSETQSSEVNLDIHSSIQPSPLNNNSSDSTALKTTSPIISNTELPPKEVKQSTSVNTYSTFGTSSSKTSSESVITAGLEGDKTPSLFNHNLFSTATTPNSNVHFEEDYANTDSVSGSTTSGHRINGLEPNVSNSFITEETLFINNTVPTKIPFNVNEVYTSQPTKPSNSNTPVHSTKDISQASLNRTVGSDSETVTKKLIEHFNIDVDYRELGGQSFEIEAYETPKVQQNEKESNALEMDIWQTKLQSNAYPTNDLAEESTQRTQGTTLRTAHVLARPSVFKHEKDFPPNNLNDKLEETYQKRSSEEDHIPNTLLPSSSEPSSNLIYSVCVAAATTVVILIVAVTVLALRNAKRKLERSTSGKKDVATVAVYTTSIFHTPLPDPPTFDNPTYISTVMNDDWAKQNEDVIEVQDFNVVFQKPPRNSHLESKPYLYDHPPSTGSYRASSDIDTLSQYNTSQHKSQIIMEPLYDEIPSRDNLVETPDIYSNVKEKRADDETITSRNNIDNNSLYVNTFGRTVF